MTTNHANVEEGNGWQNHLVLQRTAADACRILPAHFRMIRHPDSKAGGYVHPYGLRLMENGELVLIGSWNDGTREGPTEEEYDGFSPICVEDTVITFSKDLGNSWEPFTTIPKAIGRPMMFTYLGNGRLFFQDTILRVKFSPDYPSRSFFSNDYGRSWSEPEPFWPTLDERGGYPQWPEGNTLVERDDAGNIRIAEVMPVSLPGCHYPDPTWSRVGWSYDQGHTWDASVAPDNFVWEETFKGKSCTRCVNEGSLVRADNGDLVAALRITAPAGVDTIHDNLNGLAVAISQDDGRTFTTPRILFQAGRMHPTLHKLSDGRLVMNYIVRMDIAGDPPDVTMASYRRGCEALISEDNGRTWNQDAPIILDSFTFSGDHEYRVVCGHITAEVLPDDTVITAYANYLAGGISLISWRP